MTSTPIVERFDVLENGVSSLLAGDEHRPVNELNLERREEAFRHRVVPAIPLAAHAAFQAMSRQHLAVITRRVLAAAIGMMHQPFGGLSVAQGHPQRAQGQVLVDS